MTQLGFELPPAPRPRPAPPASRRAPARWREQLVAYAQDALANVPEAHELPIGELVAAGTLSESLRLLAQRTGAVADRQRWQNTLWAMNDRELERAADAHARASGFPSALDALHHDPLAGLALVEDVIVEGAPLDGRAQ